MIKLPRFLLVSAFLAASTTFGLADNYPSKPLELSCATAAGSTGAQWCQMVSEILAKQGYLGKPVRVAFRPGGSGNENGVFLDRAPADGYTLSQLSQSHAGYMNLPTFTPDPNNFEPLLRVEKFLYNLAVPADSQFKTFDDLVQYAKKNPGQLGVGGNKIGSVHHRHIVDAFGAAGATVNYIPYEGSADAVRDLLGKHIPVALGTTGQWLPHIKAGSVRVLVTLNEERIPLLPDVPTIKELGYDYPITHNFIGIMVKKGIPEERKQALRVAFRKLVESEEYKQYLAVSPHVVVWYSDDPATVQKEWDYYLKSAKDFMTANNLM